MYDTTCLWWGQGWKDLDHHTLDKVACSAIRYFDLAHLVRVGVTNRLREWG
jgi:hypothetical protein